MFAKSLNRRRHLALERLPAHLAVCRDFQSCFLLQCDRLIYRLVFFLLLNSAGVIRPSASCFCAASNSGRRSRLPTTSLRALIMGECAGMIAYSFRSI